MVAGQFQERLQENDLAILCPVGVGCPSSDEAAYRLYIPMARWTLPPSRISATAHHGRNAPPFLPANVAREDSGELWYGAATSSSSSVEPVLECPTNGSDDDLRSQKHDKHGRDLAQPSPRQLHQPHFPASPLLLLRTSMPQQTMIAARWAPRRVLHQAQCPPTTISRASTGCTAPRTAAYL